MGGWNGVGVFRETLLPSAAPDEPVAMGTVNGLGSEDSGPDINTQSLILPRSTRGPRGDFRTQRSEKWRVWLFKAKQSKAKHRQRRSGE